MFNKIFLFFCVFLLSYSLRGQEFKPVDYTSIVTTISDKNSNQYYPSLLERYEQGDTELTTDDYRMLYYGFTFQDAYRPYDRDPRDGQISELMASGIDEESTPELINIASSYLKDSPFNLKIINYLQNFLMISNDTTQIEQLQVKYDGIISAILSSGDGQSKQSGYAVNQPSDEYMVLRAMGLTPKDNRFETTIDYYSLEENELGLEGIYFDVYQMAKIGTAQMGIETIEVENEEIPENGVLIGSRDEILSFIPLGFEILDELNVDFDNDGDMDWILVLNKEGENILSDAASGNPEPRILTLLERNEDNVLIKKVSVDKAIPCIDCGDGNENDPYKGIRFENGSLIISSAGGTIFQWKRETTFIYEDEFLLATEFLKSFRKGKEDQAQTDTETSDDFGKITLSEFDFNTLLN